MKTRGQPGRTIFEDVRNHYDFHRELGKGLAGVTWLCSHKTTHGVYACKTISKNAVDCSARMQEVKVEVAAMTRLAKRFRNGHPNIARLVEVFEDKDAVHLILEYYSGGDLCDYVIQNGALTEGQALDVMRGIMCALEGCHVSGVMHRDVKPDNVMLTAYPRKECVQVKLIDFGLSTFFRSWKDSFRGAAGTSGYMAPELKSTYGIQADVWSAGITLFTLLFGRLPNCNADHIGLDVELEDDPEVHLSYAAKDILRRMLHVDPSKRMTTREFFRHPWVQNKVSTTTTL